MKRYLVVVERTETGYSAYAPDLPGCITTGRSPEEVRDNMQEAIGFHREGLRLEGLPIPEPSSESADVEVAACGRPVALGVSSPSDAYYICSTPGAVPVQEHRSMAKTKTVTVRLDPALKENVDEILDELGLTTSQAIVLFYKQVQLHHGLPFDVRIPNETTRAALEDAAARRDLGTFDSTDALFADLGI